MTRYKEHESSADLIREFRAAERLATYWRGSVLAAEPYKPYDCVLRDTDRRLVALVEIKCRRYPLEYFVTHRYWLGTAKVRSLVTAARFVDAVPLVLVACEDHDFLLDLRDESGMSVRSVNRINDRRTTEDGETVWQAEQMTVFSASRFVALSDLGGLL